jgi:nitrate reductase delta subunit
VKFRNRVDGALQDRLVWQSASLLLAYPDHEHRDRLDTVEALLGHVTGAAADALAQTLAELRERDEMAIAAEYVETFDMHKNCTLLLTYWTAGDTRNRGVQMLAFADAYRAAGTVPPKGEAPDHLPVVLEFAATVDYRAGRRLLSDHRGPIDVLRQALTDRGSRYARVVDAVSATLPAVVAGQTERLLQAGPPAEAVGLQPFQLTVPPRRVQEGG